MKNLFIGLMSGTSVDSIDSALVNIDRGSFELLESSSSLINKDLKKRIFEAVNSADISNVEIEELDIEDHELDKPANEIYITINLRCIEPFINPKFFFLINIFWI